MNRTLNKDQRAALEAVKKGKTIFLTGAGGTGKSHTIREIVSWARSAGVRCAVTAMTGCAALLLNQTTEGKKGDGAKTLHSWAGIGLARESPAELAALVQNNKRASRRWLDTNLLIIDEISMMTPELFEKLDLVGRRTRRRPAQPFGGLQIVFAGDFCQLPPVTRGASGEDMTQFLFETQLWTSTVKEVHELTTIIRQTDPVFQQILTEARMGSLSPESIKTLEERLGLPWHENEIRPTLLFTRNAEVDQINRKNMEALDSAPRLFTSETVKMEKGELVGRSASVSLISPDDPQVIKALDRLDTDAPYTKDLELKEGAQVMLITNLDQERGLVNGSRGIVTGWTPGGLPIVRFLSCRDPVIVDRANWWLADYEGIGRAQIPLRVAYAITIHKSQGATLDSALVDVGSSTFEYGQAYVALSRVKSLAGLYVWKFDPRKIRCHPKVAEFYAALAEQREPVSADPAVVGPTEDEPGAPPKNPWSLAGLSPAWLAIIEPYLASPAGLRLATQVRERAAVSSVAPDSADVFAALRACPDPAAVKVIILGQDPYPTHGHAHGLAFSVPDSVTALPPSLKNIYKELASDLNTAAPATGNLTGWSGQGVLLLNDCLTVTEGAPLSHAGLGWEDLTKSLFEAVLKAADHCVVIAWGRQAQRKLASPLIKRHTVLQAPHPSPLSAHTGFFGSRPFSQTNAALRAHGSPEIRWV